MDNGNCVLGATNATKITALEENVKGMKDCVDGVKRELSTFKYLLVATLVAAIMNLVF